RSFLFSPSPAATAIYTLSLHDALPIWLQARKPDGGTRLGAPPPGPRASGSSTTPSTSTGTPQTTGKRSSRPTITPSDFHINHEGSRNGYSTPRDLTSGPDATRPTPPTPPSGLCAIEVSRR